VVERAGKEKLDATLSDLEGAERGAALAQTQQVGTHLLLGSS